MSDVVRVEVAADRVATVSLNRPDKLNAVSPDVFTGLAEAAQQVATDPEVRAVLIRGEGRAFCSGLDLASLQGMSSAEPRASEGSAEPRASEGSAEPRSGAQADGNGQAVPRDPQAGWRLWQEMDKPVVAAVQGYALGAGFQLALAADIRFAATDAVMSVFEITYGLVPDLGGTQFLPPIVGPAKAKELIWTAKRLNAEEALALGIVNRVVELAQLETEARAFAADLASRPPMPIGFTKKIVNSSGKHSLEEGMRQEITAQMKCIGSNDMREAVSAAFEKRQGSYTGT
ncbi:MAG: enoyl-CoA hydratase/isomerase family protein [Actinomycetota bacterium]